MAAGGRLRPRHDDVARRRRRCRLVARRLLLRMPTEGSGCPREQGFCLTTDTATARRSKTSPPRAAAHHPAGRRTAVEPAAVEETAIALAKHKPRAPLAGWG